ncbi:MAG: ABC transporter ATP-binding protein [Lentimicrobiaceae bacterium]|nr:ABC transporter ATP-binding protein [Lentimicrobiaceae bacterium]MCO5264577.1 ABC transporter ATP-binding protein [Lentimicrobium sp.]
MLEIKHLNKSFGRFMLKDIHLRIEAEDYFILLGASGAGKSVLLELIAGLVKPDSGQILLNGKDITELPVDKRKTGLIFQSPAIFPHLNVSQNIAYPIYHLPKNQRNQKVAQLAGQMKIDHLLNQSTQTLSGGELQRLALARALASDPVMLLLDEPLSAIDTPLKSELRGVLRELNKSGLPILHVTHDFEEAFALATRIAVIENGSLIQNGAPHEIINSPKSGFAAGFTGEHNFYKAEIEGNIAHILNDYHSKTNIQLKLDDTYKQGPASILIRSKYVVISLNKPEISTINNFKGKIASINPSREGFEVCIKAGIDIYARITRESLEKMAIKQGMEIWACFKASAIDVIT